MIIKFVKYLPKTSGLKSQVQFLCEQRTEPYSRYGGESSAAENCIVDLRSLRGFGLRLKAGRLIQEF